MNQLNYDAFKKLFKVDVLVIMYMIISMALRYSLMIRSGSTPPSWSIATESRKFLIFLLILEPWCLNATLSHTLSMVYPNNIFMLNPPFDTPHIFQPFFKWDQFSHLRNVTYERLTTVSFKLHTKKVSPPPNSFKPSIKIALQIIMVVTLVDVVVFGTIVVVTGGCSSWRGVSQLGRGEGSFSKGQHIWKDIFHGWSWNFTQRLHGLLPSQHSFSSNWPNRSLRPLQAHNNSNICTGSTCQQPNNKPWCVDSSTTCNISIFKWSAH